MEFTDEDLLKIIAEGKEDFSWSALQAQMILEYRRNRALITEWAFSGLNSSSEKLEPLLGKINAVLGLLFPDDAQQVVDGRPAVNTSSVDVKAPDAEHVG